MVVFIHGCRVLPDLPRFPPHFTRPAAYAVRRFAALRDMWCAVVAVSASLYGCTAHKDRGATVCAGIYVSRRDAEMRLLSTLRDDLLSPSAVASIQAEVSRLVRERSADAMRDRQASQAKLSTLDRDIGNLVDAIAVAGMSDTLRKRLAETEAERSRLQIAVSAVTHPDIPSILTRYRALLADLPAALKREPGKARAALREILGEVRLFAKGPEVWSEMETPPERILLISNVFLRVVAGVGFCSQLRPRCDSALYRYAEKWQTPMRLH